MGRQGGGIAIGLDWMLDRRKPRPGYERDYARLDRRLRLLEARHEEGKVDEARYQCRRREMEIELDRVGVSPFEIIGCPRIGIDEEATRWFRERLYAPNHDAASRNPKPAKGNKLFVAHWERPFDEVLKDHYGKWVPTMAEKKEGFAEVGGILTSAVDFRGQVVGGAGELVGEEPACEAYENHTAEGCLDYARRLRDALGVYVGKHPVAQSAPPIVEAIQDLRSAARWLQYWGRRGFGYEAWY